MRFNDVDRSYRKSIKVDFHSLLYLRALFIRILNFKYSPPHLTPNHLVVFKTILFLACTDELHAYHSSVLSDFLNIDLTERLITKW